MIYFTIPPGEGFPYPRYVYLPVVTPECAALYSRKLDPADVLEFDPCGWNHSLHHLPATYPGHFPVSVGTLYWPVTASQFSVGYFLATQEDVDKLQDTAFNQYGPQEVTLTLTEADEDRPLGQTGGKQDFKVYLLPPRVLDDIDGTDTDEQLYLLTVVDQRYYWWFYADKVEVVVDTTTWEDLIDRIGEVLGVDLNPSGDIDLGYGKPSNRYTAYNQPLPLLLDAALAQVGYVLVAKYDGTFEYQDYTASKAVQDLNDAKVDPAEGADYPLAGGVFDPDILAQSVPEKVSVVFSRKLSTTGYSYEPFVKVVRLTDLALTNPDQPFEGVTGFDGQKTIMGDMTALVTPPADPTNLADLTNYARLIADSFYTNCLADRDQSFSGIADWTPNGLTDLIRFDYTVGNISTRVQRPRWEDKGWGRVRLSDLPGMASSYPAASAEIRFNRVQSVNPQATSITVTLDDDATTYTVETFSGDTVSVSGSGTGEDDTASDLRDALAASTDDGFACAIWSVSGATVTYTPATITVSTTGGTGTMSVGGGVVSIDSYDAATTYKVTINGIDVSTVGTGGTTTATATALQVALAASTDEGFADATWVASTNTVTRSPVPGCPYGLSASTTGGTGTLSTTDDGLYPAKEVLNDLAKTEVDDCYYRSANDVVPALDSYHEVVLLTDLECGETKIYQDAENPADTVAVPLVEVTSTTPQVNTFTVTDDDTSTTYSADLNGHTVSVSGTGTGTDDTAAAWQAALAASVDVGFANATWDVVGSVVSWTPGADMPDGTIFDLSVSASGGSGTVSTTSNNLFPAREIRFSASGGTTLGAVCWLRDANGIVPLINQYYEAVLSSGTLGGKRVYENSAPPLIVTVEIAATEATSTTGGDITAGAGVVVTPSSMQYIVVGSSIIVDEGGDDQEEVLVTAVTDTTFTADFALDHPTGTLLSVTTTVGGNYRATERIYNPFSGTSYTGDSCLFTGGAGTAVIAAGQSHNAMQIDYVGGMKLYQSFDGDPDATQTIRGYVGIKTTNDDGSNFVQTLGDGDKNLSWSLRVYNTSRTDDNVYNHSGVITDMVKVLPASFNPDAIHLNIPAVISTSSASFPDGGFSALTITTLSSSTDSEDNYDSTSPCSFSFTTVYNPGTEQLPEMRLVVTSLDTAGGTTGGYANYVFIVDPGETVLPFLSIVVNGDSTGMVEQDGVSTAAINLGYNSLVLSSSGPYAPTGSEGADTFPVYGIQTGSSTQWGKSGTLNPNAIAGGGIIVDLGTAGFSGGPGLATAVNGYVTAITDDIDGGP